MCNRKNVIYEINCSICHKIYIGETQRMIRSRLNEHIFLQNTDSSVKYHFRQEHPNVPVSISWRILHGGLPNYRQRKTLEAMYIKKANPDLLMNYCNGWNVHTL